MLVSFVLELITSEILYIVPEGRVAYWADWHLWGLTKSQWSALHLNLGLLMILAGGLHIYYNWRPIVGYLKNRAREVRVFTREFNIALMLGVLFSLGTYFEVPPLNWVIAGSEWFQERAARQYGEPPYGHAEQSSLGKLAKNTGLDLDSALANLRAQGVALAGPDEIVEEVAARNGMTPQQIYQIMQSAPEVRPAGPRAIPDPMPPGTGRRTLRELCETYQLDQDAVLAALAARGWAAEPTDQVRAIAEAHDIATEDVIAILRKFAP